jgi:hypothetical protein
VPSLVIASNSNYTSDFAAAEKAGPSTPHKRSPSARLCCAQDDKGAGDADGSKSAIKNLQSKIFNQKSTI